MNKNDYAPIAPMGWNSYDYYDTTVNEEQVRANAAYLAEHLKDAGYEYVVVDIEWYAKKAGSQRNTYQYIPYSELAIDEYSRYRVLSGSLYGAEHLFFRRFSSKGGQSLCT